MVTGCDCIADADVVIVPIGKHDLLLDSPGRHLERVWWRKLVLLGICLALILKSVVDLNFEEGRSTIYIELYSARKWQLTNISSS